MNGEELKKILTKLGWTNIRLATELGVHASSVSNWLADKSPISKTTERAILDLIGQHDDKPPEMLSIKERCLLIASELGLSYEKFFRSLKMNYASFKGKNISSSVNSDFLIRLIKAHNVNPYWLLLGEGEMFEKKKVVLPDKGNTESMQEIMKWMEQVIEKDKIIYDLRTELDRVKDDLADERIRNSRLESKLHEADKRAAS